MTNWIHNDQLNHNLLPYFTEVIKFLLIKGVKIELWSKNARVLQQFCSSNSKSLVLSSNLTFCDRKILFFHDFGIHSLSFIRKSWNFYRVGVFWTLSSCSLFLFLNFKEFLRTFMNFCIQKWNFPIIAMNKTLFWSIFNLKNQNIS